MCNFQMGLILMFLDITEITFCGNPFVKVKD
jgi:hypothetical protein